MKNRKNISNPNYFNVTISCLVPVSDFMGPTEAEMNSSAATEGIGQGQWELPMLVHPNTKLTCSHLILTAKHKLLATVLTMRSAQKVLYATWL